MTRKSVKFPSGLRRGPWRSSLMKRECDDKIAPASILVSASCAKRWSSLKSKFHFRSDSELVEYLLALGEAQPNPSTSPDHESDDVWCTSSPSGRKKRGPSLRAVLRRSTRNSGSKSDFLPESVEREGFHTEDSCLSVEDTERSRKLSGSNSRNTKFSDYNDLLSKESYHGVSGLKKDLNSDDEKEAKANQLDAELALLVESVALQSQERNENELYEFRHDPESEKRLSPGNSHKTENSNNSNYIAKTSHKRWKSYHKDKRKWKQSYAAVMPDDENDNVLKLRTKAREESACTSGKERKIFKALKKNCILTAYLDSQNKIAANSTKDSSCPSNEDVDLPVKEEDKKPDIQEPSPCLKKIDKVHVDSDSNKGKDDGTGLKVPGKEDDVSSGKENQTKIMSSEPVFIEVGERVKLKRRKKKIIHDSDDSLSNSKGDDSVSLNVSDSNELEAHHHKQKRNWKKSIINYELEEMELNKRKRAALDSSLNSSNIPSNTAAKKSDLSLTENRSEIKPDDIDIPSVENAIDVPHSNTTEFHENDRHEQENNHSKTKNCSLCNTRHPQQSCPVQSPYHVVRDSISFEQWQLQCQVQVRCSVIEAPRQKSGRLRRSITGSPISTDVEKKNKDTSTGKSEIENTHYYAEESLPLGIGLKVINEEHGKSVVAQAPIARYTQFGPLVGPRVHEKDISDESDMRHIWEVLDEKQAIYLNTEDPQTSNWLRFMRPAPEREDRNITLMVQNKQLYFVSINDISKGDELLYWADDHITLWSKKKILKSSCGGCNMRFAHPLYYRTHCAVFHDPSHSLTIRKYHCKVCGEAVMGKENIMKHAADLHEGRGAYQCQYCHKFFLRLNYLEMHRTYGCSSNPHRTRPLCDFCGRYFCQPQKLKVHIKRMHSDMNEVLREFQCKSCLKILGSRAALQRHFKEVHHRDVVMTSNCDRCGKSFQNRSNLKIHMLTHSGVKPFRCQQEGCSAAFTTKQCLQFHYKKAHGLSEDALPRIERSIAYTFDAYAGETVDGSSKSADQMKKPQRVLRKGRKSSAKSQRNRIHSLQSVETESHQEPDEPLPPLPHETGTFETSVLQECSEHLQVNDVVEQHSFSTVSIPTTASEPLLLQKYIDSEDTTHENSLPPPEVIDLPYGEEEKQLNSDKTLTPLRTVTLRHHSEESYHPLHGTPMMTCHSPSQSPLSPNQDLHSVINLESKGHKKWLGEVIEVAEEAAAAAMRLSPRLSPRMKRDLYDFDEHKVKSKLQYVDNAVRQDLQIEVGSGRSKTASALAPFHPPESASMLVEAALDAAERDICCPSLALKTSPNISNNSPEPLHLPHPSYCGTRSPSCGDLSSPPYYVPDPTNVPASDPSLSHYPLNHSPNPHPHIHQLDSFTANPQRMSPSRLYNVHHHHQHQLLPAGPPSSDDDGGMESDCNTRGECAQNLSLNVKHKASLRSDVSPIYNVSEQNSDLTARSSAYQDHISLPQQNDLNFSGSMVASPPRYHLYDLSPDRPRSDIPVTDPTICNRSSSHDYSSYCEEIGGSVDLTLPRTHSSSEGHIILASSSVNYNSHHISPSLPHLSPSQHGHPGPAHQYAALHSMPSYSSHPAAYQNSPLQRPHISSSSNSPSGSPSPGPAHYHSYPPYY